MKFGLGFSLALSYLRSGRAIPTALTLRIADVETALTLDFGDGPTVLTINA